MPKILDKITQLRKDIIKHTQLYEQNQPIITDSEFDALYKELVKLESTYPEYYSEESPTQKIYTVVVKGLKKVKHSRPMISQANIDSKEGIIKFCSLYPNDYILVQHKLDGLTVVLTYKKGKLIQAVTRGNGLVGEDVTHTIRTCSNVPLTIDTDEDIELRGEALIYKEDFERYNTTGDYSNTRNLASGTVRQLDASVAKERNLQLIIFDLVKASNHDFETDTEQLKFVRDLGFTVVPTRKFHIQTQKEELIKFILEYNEKYRNQLAYGIDGLVLKYNSLKIRELLGETIKYPRWGTAFKFPSNNAVTTLRDIKLSMGKTGQVTPVGIFDAIEIDNVSIDKASLANFNIIKNKDIRIGDKILVERAKDVIPNIVKAFKEHRKEDLEEYKIPTHCPKCQSELVEKHKGTMFCVNEKCPSTIIKKIIHFASKQSFNIVGFSDKTIELLYNENILVDIPSIYLLKDNQEKLISLYRFGETRVQNILDSIEKSKIQTSDRFLTALCIDNIGSKVAKDIAKIYSIQELMELVQNNPKQLEEKLLSIKGFGEKIVFSIVDYFSNKNNIDMMIKLFELGVTIEDTEQEIVVSNKLTDKNFVITGTLSVPRKELVKIINENGGKVQSAVSSTTDYLILNDVNSKSSKAVKARDLEKPIITEEQFRDLLK